MFAAIDIGTNTTLLLIGEMAGDGTVRVIEDRAIVTRLGEGVAESGLISGAAADRTLEALRLYWELCAKHVVQRVAAVGTAALRNASNAGDFLLLAKRSLGLDIEVVSAEREAALTYAASAHDFGADIVVVDIGGGSTEFTCRDGDGALHAVSIPAGSVSLTEKFLKSDPVAEDECALLRAQVRSLLESNLEPLIFSRPYDRRLVATAGTATTLMAMNLRLIAYDPARVHRARLTIGELRDLIDAIRPKRIDERKKMPGLDPDRADVILAGAEILHDSMSFLGFADVTVSDRGVRWGLFYEEFCK